MPSRSQLKNLPGTPAAGHYWRGENGVQIAGDRWGPGSSDTVVFLLHGGGQTRHAWKNTGVALSERGYDVVALDARGHGDSGWAQDGDYDELTMVKDLRHVIERVGASKAILVGASMGGVVSLLAAGGSYVDAAAVVLVDVAPRLEPRGVAEIKSFMDQRPDGFATLEDVADDIARFQPHRRRPRDLGGLAKNVRVGDDGRLYWHWDPRLWIHRMDHQARYLLLRRCARALRVPTLLIRGARSEVLSEVGAREFLEDCPHADYVDVAEAAHMVAGDRNDAFSNVVDEFLNRSSPPSPPAASPAN